MNSIIYIVGLIVVIGVVLSFLGFDELLAITTGPLLSGCVGDVTAASLTALLNPAPSIGSLVDDARAAANWADPNKLMPTGGNPYPVAS